MVCVDRLRAAGDDVALVADQEIGDRPHPRAGQAGRPDDQGVEPETASRARLAQAQPEHAATREARRVAPQPATPDQVERTCLAAPGGPVGMPAITRRAGIRGPSHGIAAETAESDAGRIAGSPNALVKARGEKISRETDPGIALKTSRRSTVGGRPSLGRGGSSGATTSHSSSVRSLSCRSDLRFYVSRVVSFQAMAASLVWLQSDKGMPHLGETIHILGQPLRTVRTRNRPRGARIGSLRSGRDPLSPHWGPAGAGRPPNCPKAHPIMGDTIDISGRRTDFKRDCHLSTPQKPRPGAIQRTRPCLRPGSGSLSGAFRLSW